MDTISTVLSRVVSFGVAVQLLASILDQRELECVWIAAVFNFSAENVDARCCVTHGGWDTEDLDRDVDRPGDG